MNWNGGTLPRASKNAKTSLSTVQKRHFAKARAKLQNGPPSSPRFDFSIFEDSKHKENKSKRADSRAGGHHRGHEFQRTLDESANTKPLVRHLESIKPRHRRYCKSSTPLVKSEGSCDYEHQLGRARQPSAAHSCSSPSSGSTSQVAASGIRRSSIEAPELPVADSLDAKRQELLRTRDWVGLDYTRSAYVAFAELKDRDLIGRRRPVGKRDHQRERGAGNKRIKTAYGYERLYTTIHAPLRSASPENISIRIGSTRSGSRPEHTLSADQDYNSVTSEEMLLAQEELGTTRAYENHKGHVYSQRLQLQQLATQRQIDPHIPPSFLRGSPVSHSRFVLQSSSWGNEERAAVPPIRILESTPGDRIMTQTGDFSLPSVRATVDEDTEPRRVFNLSPQTGQEYQNKSMTADLNIPVASSKENISGVTPRATPTKLKRHERAVRHCSINLESVINGDALNVSPFVDTTLCELATKEERLNLEIIAAKAEATMDMLDTQPVESIVAVENSESTGIEDEQQGDLDHAMEWGRIPNESPQDEEKLWRDFVFGHDYDNTEEAIDIPKDHLLPRKCDQDGSSMIAEFDFQEVLLPKRDSLDTGSSVVVEASQPMSAINPDSPDLPSVRLQASRSPFQTQQITSDVSSDDPLSWTPTRLKAPGIIFQKPYKYLGDQDVTLSPIRIGHYLRRNKIGGDRSFGDSGKEKGHESEMTRVLEDDIEDD